MTLILGIDPGIERVGFGLVHHGKRGHYTVVEWGLISTSKYLAEAARLHQIQQDLTALIVELKPTLAAVEQLFFFKNAKTVMPVSQARGVIITTLFAHGIPYQEFTPMQVKRNLTGHGHADKKEIQQVLMQLFNLEEVPQPDDASDALAIALSCAFEQDAGNILTV
jgi:crossover junction endodeoxyribonuclease RuvC